MLCVRWYLRYSLSYRDLEEMMAERGLAVDHVTIWRWVQHYAPLLNQRLRGELRRPNASWRVDETYIKVAGTWTYLYRAVDSAGDTIDSIPRRGFCGRYDRFPAFPETRFDGGAPVPALGLVRDRRHSAPGNQCGWASGICPRDCRIEAIRGSGAALPLPAVTSPETVHRWFTLSVG
jgi:hypothetical protein